MVCQKHFTKQSCRYYGGINHPIVEGDYTHMHKWAHTNAHTNAHTFLSRILCTHCLSQVMWPFKQGRDKNSKSGHRLYLVYWQRSWCSTQKPDCKNPAATCTPSIVVHPLKLFLQLLISRSYTSGGILALALVMCITNITYHDSSYPQY